MIMKHKKILERLAFFVDQLKERGFEAEGKLGFSNRAKEIVKFVKESEADMLVVGAHGHTGVKDLIYGETVNTVRHELKIPILMVRLKRENLVSKTNKASFFYILSFISAAILSFHSCCLCSINTMVSFLIVLVLQF